MAQKCFSSLTLLANLRFNLEQVVYILDQVKALEEELLLRIKQQGLNVKPQILVVSLVQMNALFIHTT